ncbi:MAG: diheme cytochrome c-553 [Flavobacteriaceae bacterium]|nr:diheme cytochrome c-553 [Flavobacteriaceae bacterium]
MIPGSNSLKSIFLSVSLISIFMLLISCNEKKHVLVPELKEFTEQDYINRGGYLVNSIGCHDCLSPKRMGERGPEAIEELMFSGYPSERVLPEISTDALQKGWMLMNEDLTAFVGPWGVSFAANLTSDDTGIGSWKLEQFKIALKKGKFKGLENGRELLPPMPWQNFANITDEDLKAIFYYLQSTKPVNNVVPATIPPSYLTGKNP